MRIIAGEFKNYHLLSPKGLATRPTKEQTRAAIFNIIGPNLNDKIFLDLFAGSGAIGFEALSRGAKSVYFIEKDKLALNALEANQEKLKVNDRVHILKGDTLKIILKLTLLNIHFDYIYLDPPYDNTLAYQAILGYIDESNLLVCGGSLFVEERRKKTQSNLSLYSTLKLKSERTYGSCQINHYEKGI